MTICNVYSVKFNLKCNQFERVTQTSKILSILFKLIIEKWADLKKCLILCLYCYPVCYCSVLCWFLIFNLSRLCSTTIVKRYFLIYVRQLSIPSVIPFIILSACTSSFKLNILGMEGNHDVVVTSA